MPKIQLQVFDDPGALEVFIRYQTTSGNFEWRSCMVDTGAPISLFPLDMLHIVDHLLTDKSRIQIEQAGIARHSFEAVEAYITIALEDTTGARSNPFEIRAWFADTSKALIGFDGVLDRAILHANLKTERDAWIDID